MGNEHSTQRKRQKANAAETKVQNGELNGHAVPPSDSTEPAVCKEAQQQKSEIPPATDTNKPKPPSGKEEVDKGKEPPHAETSPEKDTTTAADAEPPKDVPKATGEDVSNFFGKMFKKKAEPMKAASEIKDSVDGQVTAVDEKSEIVIINADQEEILKDAAGDLQSHLVDIIPTQPISEELTCPELPTNKVALESTSSNDEALTFSDVLPDRCGTQEPEVVAEEFLTVAEVSKIGSEEPVFGSQLHIENLQSAEEELPVKAPEELTADAEQTLTEDKELIKKVEVIISDEEEQLVTNGLESDPVERKCEGTSVIDSTDGFVKALVEDEQQVDESKEPLLVAEEIAAIVQEIVQITEDQVVGIAREQNGEEETMRQGIEEEESEVTLDALEAPEMLSESSVVVEDEMTCVESILTCNGTAAVDDESWVIIEEPAPAYTYSKHPETVEEELPTSPSKADEERDDLAKLLSQLRFACIEAFDDSSYKPVSVDVCGNESTIHIKIEVCPIDKDESGNNTAVRAEEKYFTRKIGENDVHCITEPVAIKANAEAVPEPEGSALELLEDLAEVAQEIQQQEDPKEAEKTVMNFFKTFVSPTKTSKEAKATPDASKDQSQKETSPAPSGNAQEAPKAPPPPPPAPPKMEGKADAAVKKEETSATVATKAAEASAKTKTKDSAFSKLFRPKMLLGKVVSKVQAATASGGRAKTSGAPDVVEEKKPVEVQVDASKTSTLEAAAKPEEPPAPKPEEKKPEKKSAFGSMFKPKVLLGQVSSRIQAAASSAAASVALVSPRSAPEPKKETPAAPAAAESAPVAKAKEEPKPATPATPAAPDNKSAESTDDTSPNIPRKLEKRNSIQLFFKNLGQKRHSDAEVQTDPVAPEKAK